MFLREEYPPEGPRFWDIGCHVLVAKPLVMPVPAKPLDEDTLHNSFGHVLSFLRLFLELVFPSLTSFPTAEHKGRSFQLS